MQSSALNKPCHPMKDWAHTPRLCTESRSNSHSSHNSGQEIFGPSPVIHRFLDDEKCSSPEANLRAHLQPFFYPSQYRVVVLTLMIQIPPSRCSRKPMRILGSETHTCRFASVRDTQRGSGEKSPCGRCWEAEIKWDGETIFVKWKRLWMILNCAARMGGKLCTFHSASAFRE